MIFATPVLVARLTNIVFVALKKQHLGAAFACINFGGQRRGVAELQRHITFPLRLERGHVDADAAAGLGALAQANGQHVARYAEILHGAGQREAVGRDDADIAFDVHKAALIEVFGVHHRAVNVGEHLELRGAADVIAITAGAVADDFLTCRVLANLAWLKRLDHAVLLRHSADPFVAFNRHLFIFPTFFNASQHCKVPTTRKLPCDAEKDFTPIGMIGSTPNVLCINTSLPPQNFKAFLDYVKQNPGRLSYGSAGAGSLTHLAAELFKLQTNSFMVHIPYRGIAPAITDLIGGQTQLMFPGLAAALPHIRSGRIRALAVTGTKRHPQVKDIPTLEEMGLKGFDAQQWYGVVGPANMPAAIVKTLNDAMLTVLSQPDFKEKLSSEAVELMPMKPAEFAAYMKADLARWTQLAKTRKIQLDS